MAVSAPTPDDSLDLPESTGAVKTPTRPIKVQAAVAQPESTGAVPYEAPGETLIGDLGQDVVITAPTPGPVTFTQGGVPQTKVIDRNDPRVDSSEQQLRRDRTARTSYQPGDEH